MHHSTPIFVLSLDGGGIFGIIPLCILKHIEQETGKSIAKLFHLISGVSTGGIIALGLVQPSDHSSHTPEYSAEKLLAFYKTQATFIFKKTRTARCLQVIPGGEYLHNLFSTKYTPEGAENFFDRVFAKKMLSQAIIPVLIPAYNIKGNAKGPKIKLFSSYKSHQAQNDDFLMKDVALATSAAPTYFPPRRFLTRKKRWLHLIDGGVAINDPSLLAYTEACSIYAQSRIFIFSVGIGPGRHSYHTILTQSSPGLWAWRNKIVKLILEPQLSVYQKVLSQLSQQNKLSYLRIQSHIPKTQFDDISKSHIQFLEKTAYQLIHDSKKELDFIIKYLQKI